MSRTPNKRRGKEAKLANARPPQNRDAGWYPDPLSGKKMRYWSGEKWTRQSRREAVSAEPVAHIQRGRQQLAVGIMIVGATILLASLFLPVISVEHATAVPNNKAIAHWQGGVIMILSGVLAGGAIRILRSDKGFPIIIGTALLAVFLLSTLNVGELPVGQSLDGQSVAVGGPAGAGIILGVWGTLITFLGLMITPGKMSRFRRMNIGLRRRRAERRGEVTG